ncbi:FKBP-type peptidyl-prolyl cis-trans isomerase [Paucihalobacter sp.]|uniref:FKBP-type peptidyl-prolyl cis-trans isomerase n=1 Tax=Paucihalobacter sp. TaxID=2850405 RepID=UPI002FE0D37C
MKRIFTVLALAILVIGIGCSPDDPDFVPVPERDRSEQQLTDNDSLIGYFETHYYNWGDLQGEGDLTIDDIVISELPKDEDGNYLALPDPDNNRMLMGNVDAFTTTFRDIEYTYYILSLNQGGGEARPNFSDNVRVRYSGNLQNATVFDSSASPVVFDLTNVVPGWNRVMPKFNVASSFTINGDGTVQYFDYGVGVMFIPSGLAYFATPPFGVPVYSNLIFKFELYQTEVLDHDNDGIPSYMEDLDGDFNLFNDDTDGDRIPNYLDPDDDGDGVPTRDEIIINPDGTIVFPDSNGNETPDYLDPTYPENS